MIEYSKGIFKENIYLLPFAPPPPLPPQKKKKMKKNE